MGNHITFLAEMLKGKNICQEPILKKIFVNKPKLKICSLTGGSDRIFLRVSDGKESYIFMYDENKENFLSFISINQFLQENFIPVPRIYEYDLSSRKVLLEDLGNSSLFNKILSTESLAEKKRLYQKVIDVLVRLQGLQLLNQSPIKKKVFDYEQLRWETDYFTQYFLKTYCKIIIKNSYQLEEGFHQLATSFLSEPHYFMHRDFQSQNIILKGKNPYLIDFQGAKMGPLTYDLASLLYDCYIVLEDELRESLFLYYINQREKILNIYQDRDKLKSLFIRSALQRNMQALGAFSFLTLIKKKKEFEKFIPTGIEYLKQNLTLFPPLAPLKKLIEKLASK